MTNLRSRGFSLIEVMVIIAIISILASTAIPQYKQFLNDARRADARHLLLSNAQRLERCFTLAGSYEAQCTLRTESVEGYYTGSAVRTALTYELTAVPTSKGGQSADADCQQFKLDHRGLTSATGDDASRCW